MRTKDCRISFIKFQMLTIKTILWNLYMKGHEVIWKMQNKRLIAVIGPSGCGKSSLVKSTLQTYGSFLNKVQMVTTRPKRSDNEDYIFMTADEFARALLQGELAEAQFFN